MWRGEPWEGFLPYVRGGMSGGGDCMCHFRAYGDCDCGKDYRSPTPPPGVRAGSHEETTMSYEEAGFIIAQAALIAPALIATAAYAIWGVMDGIKRLRAVRG